MYEYMCGDAPSSLYDFFQTNSDVHFHATRYANHINVPYGRLDIMIFRFKISGANLWNSLPDMLKKNPLKLVQLMACYLTSCLPLLKPTAD